MSRKAILLYFFFISLFSIFIYFFVSFRQQKLFSPQALEVTILTPSQWRIKYLSPCDSAIRGDPSIGDNWVKITFHCPQGAKNSTLALTVLEKKTWRNVIIEYSRIIGFSPSEVLDEEEWTCYLEGKTLISNQGQVNWDSLARKKVNLECVKPDLDLDYFSQ